MRSKLVPLAALAVLLHAGAAHAQGTDPAAAQTLFDEAKRLLAHGKVSEACPKFLASLKLDPAPGAAYNLADCYEKNGQTASAWARYLEAAQLAQHAGQAARVKAARAQAAALEPKLSRLLIAAASPPSGLSITRDGVPIEAVVWGTAVPVDPGKHVVEALAPGKKPWSITVTIAAGDATARVEVPTLPDVAEPPSPVSGGSSPVPPVEPGPTAPRGDEAASTWSGQKIAGVALMGAGVVGGVIGAVFAAQAHSKFSDLAKACPTQMACDPSLAAELSSYHATGNASLGSFIAGGAVLGAGIIVFVTAPKAKPREGAFVVPRLGPGTLWLEGGF